MPNFKDILPKPGDEVAGELPGATDKVKSSKGTFLLWVLTCGSVIMGALAWGWYLSAKARLIEKNEVIEACKNEVTKEQKENRDLLEKLNNQNDKLERILAYGVSALEGVKAKSDQLETAVKDNAKTFNTATKTLQHEANR